MLTVLGVILLVFALFLIVSVLMQHGKAKNISGAIAGGAETFFGKTKGSTLDKKLSKLTTIVAIVFCVLVLVSYLIQDTTDLSQVIGNAALDTTAGEVEHDHDHEGEVVEGETAETEAEGAAE